MTFTITYRAGSCYVLGLVVFLATAAVAQGPAAEATSASNGPLPSPTTVESPDHDWHVGFTPYLWVAGVHGAAGARGHEVAVHATFGDIFDYLNIGLMGEMEAHKGPLLLVTDFMWMKLSDEKAVPINEIGLQSVDAGAKQFLLTPAAGYRIVDTKLVKIDALGGIRYWHLGQDLKFTPSLFGGVSQSQNWVDGIGGARIHIPVWHNVLVTIAGDAGGGGADVDYQVAGFLGYRIGKRYVVQAGWRYLDVNYRGSQSFVYDVATSGALVGVTINFK